MQALAALVAIATSLASSGISYTTRISLTSDPSIDIRFCTFIGLTAGTDNYGGAMLINCSSAYVSVVNSLFEYCNATYEGGAIYTIVSSARIYYCCYYYCACGYTHSGHGTAFTINPTGNTTLRYQSALKCPFDVQSDSTVFRVYGSANASNLNSSYCKLSYSGNLMFSDSSSAVSSALYIGSYNHIAANAIGFYANTQSDTFQYGNFVNISNTNGAVFLWYGNNIILNNFYFIDCNNGAIAYSYTGSNSITLINCFTNINPTFGANVVVSSSNFEVYTSKLTAINMRQLSTFLCSGYATLFTFQTKAFSSANDFRLSKIAFAFRIAIFESLI